MKLISAILSFTVVTALLFASVPPSLAAPLDFEMPYGHFFKQANGQGGAGDMGFAVVDDTAPFWSEFQRRGGVAALGYPISRRFEWDGFLVQAFQKAIFQWRPEVGQVYFINVFDRLSTGGKDDWLSVVRSTPPSFDTAADRLGYAIETADVRFFLDNVVFEDLKCDADFPAPPKSCSGKPQGATVPGIIAGVWMSEGFGLDASGYEAYIREFLTSTDLSASDAFGDPRPQLYSYGILKSELQGASATKEMVQAFATRITSGSKAAPQGRSVLILHVGFDGNRWRIARLTATPAIQLYPPVAALLDPSRPEAKEIFQYWRRGEP